MLRNLFLTVFADSGQTYANTDRHDPYKNFNFRVTITGKTNFVKAGFSNVTGIKGKTDVVEYRDGNDTQLSPHKSGGLVKYDPITLERGMSEDKDIWNWFIQQIRGVDGEAKCTMKIELLDRNRTAVKTWELLECWASDYETGDFDAQGNGVAIDRMVVHFEEIKDNI